MSYNIGAFTERLETRPYTWLLNIDDNLESKIDEIMEIYLLDKREEVMSENYVSHYKKTMCLLKDYYKYFV